MFNEARKAQNDPSADELKKSYLFSEEHSTRKGSKHDITLILGSDEDSSYASILLCRFHKFDAKLKMKQKENLLNDLWEALKSKKFECRRSGGSSGIITKSSCNIIHNLIRQPGSCPRNGHGSIWLEGIDTWYLYYIGTYDGEAKRCLYTNPVPGGSFKLGHKSLGKYRFLIPFISTKPITALIVNAISQKLMKNENFKVRITPQAIEAELKNIEETRLTLEGNEVPIDMKELPSDMKGSMREKFYYLYNLYFIKYTLVMHSVGLHRDTFADGVPSVENKVCFDMPKCNVPLTDIVRSHPNGRGGGKSSDVFVFGLLDWSSGQRARRRTWTDPANAALINGPNQFPLHQGLNQQIWNGFWNPNTVHVPKGVDARNF